MRQYRKFFSVLLIAIVALLVVAPGVASAAPAQGPSGTPDGPYGYGHGYGYGCWYQVRWGDTLANVAYRYGVSASYLRSLNGLANPNYIRAGQWLRVPCGYPYHPGKHYYWSSTYHCWGYSYWNAYYGKYIFICTSK